MRLALLRESRAAIVSNKIERCSIGMFGSVRCHVTPVIMCRPDCIHLKLNALVFCAVHREGLRLPSATHSSRRGFELMKRVISPRSASKSMERNRDSQHFLMGVRIWVQCSFVQRATHVDGCGVLSRLTSSSGRTRAMIEIKGLRAYVSDQQWLVATTPYAAINEAEKNQTCMLDRWGLRQRSSVQPRIIMSRTIERVH